jgi:hypothetical protein
VLDEAASIPRHQCLQRSAHRLDQSLAATSPAFPQQRLELGERFGERFVYGIEIGG